METGPAHVSSAMRAASRSGVGDRDTSVDASACTLPSSDGVVAFSLRAPDIHRPRRGIGNISPKPS
jgi:hypothetical protein